MHPYLCLKENITLATNRFGQECGNDFSFAGKHMI